MEKHHLKLLVSRMNEMMARNRHMAARAEIDGDIETAQYHRGKAEAYQLTIDAIDRIVSRPNVYGPVGGF